MNSFKANVINSLSLIFIGLWGYFEVVSPTALIPVIFGVILLAIAVKLFAANVQGLFN